MTSNLSRPTSGLLAGQYSSPHAQAFAPSPPQQYGQAQTIPKTQNGDTSQKSFFKINKSLTPGPIAKIVIAIQQARF